MTGSLPNSGGPGGNAASVSEETLRAHLAEKDAAYERSAAVKERLVERWKRTVAASHAAAEEHPAGSAAFEYHRGFAHGVVHCLNELRTEEFRV